MMGETSFKPGDKVTVRRGSEKSDTESKFDLEGDGRVYTVVRQEHSSVYLFGGSDLGYKASRFELADDKPEKIIEYYVKAPEGVASPSFDSRENAKLFGLAQGYTEFTITKRVLVGKFKISRTLEELPL